MPSAISSLFCKRSSCPSSERLLSYQRAHENDAAIEAHLNNCDFCNAEVRLLSRYADGRNDYSFVEMPASLRRLAEVWLKRNVTSLRHPLRA